MIKTLKDVKLRIGEGEQTLYALAAKNLGKQPKYFRIVKKSLDSRKKSDIFWVYTIEFSDKPQESLRQNKYVENLPEQVVIVGNGPCGLFCALELIEYGVKPIIIERGDEVENRIRAIDEFYSEKKLNENCNVQFGEGGAGTFSDGKLNTQTNDVNNFSVLSAFVRFGAPEEILYLNKPHIGSDLLRKIIVSMRKYIQSKGGRYYFNTQFIDFEPKGKGCELTCVNLKTNDTFTLFADDLVLAIGHSSRDTYKMLRDKQVELRQKDFAVGFRIEHLQKDISLSQYGEKYTYLPPADYKLVSHAAARSVFSFCMCPGGYVMGAASEAGGVVVNGMSNYARDAKNANSAIVAQVRTSDFANEDALAGVEYQRSLERRAFDGSYRVPVQLLSDFFTNKMSSGFGKITPSCPCGTYFAKLDKIVGESIAADIKISIKDMANRLRGFDCGDAVLSAIESRTSSPVRIVRDESRACTRFSFIYPSGEGAGYAGGITSSAVDGIKTAAAIIGKYNK